MSSRAAHELKPDHPPQTNKLLTPRWQIVWGGRKAVEDALDNRGVALVDSRLNLVRVWGRVLDEEGFARGVALVGARCLATFLAICFEC